jgi:DMATS type aromatic prenyltransferase
MISHHATKGSDAAQRPRIDSSLQDFSFSKGPTDDATQKRDDTEALVKPSFRKMTPPDSSSAEPCNIVTPDILANIDDGDAIVFAQQTNSHKSVKPSDRFPARDSLAMGFGFLTPSQEFWWNGLAPVLEKLMEKADYPEHIQYSYFAFIAKFILPSLGAHGKNQVALPRITHDRSPFEPSLNISKSGLNVRFTAEPRGQFAGFPQDPFGQVQGRKLFDEILAFSPMAASVDSKLFNHYTNEFWLPDSAAADINLTIDRMPPQCQLAFDLNPKKSSLGMKAYFIPLLKSKHIGSTPQQVAFDAMERGDATGALTPSLTLLKDYMTSLPDSRKASIQMLAVDCVDPAVARIKCYAKAYQVSIANVLDMYTMGGRLSSQSTADGLAILKDIAPLLLDCEGEAEDALLTRPLLAHPHGGIVAAYELRPGAPEPEVKMYIPVWCFVGDDRVMAGNLGKVFLRLGWERRAESYGQEFEEMFAGHDLSKAGTHTYVSFGYTEKGGSYVTLYYSPGGGMEEA